jgi:Asp-tRNA(Asn)/Glu-tRNA(Gln) amidotransferase A subunit family amidase
MNSLADLVPRLRSGTDTSVRLTKQAIAQAETDEHGAFVELLTEQALDAARCADRELAEGIDRGPLHGIPVAVKDNIDVAGAWTRFGTSGLGHHLAERDADVVARLRAANAVVVGKTRLHELAWGMVTPGCRNPRDPSRITGGSSGGSAAAVAAGIVPLALGTDTGGSVRNPAALCGVVGVKTAVGAMSMDGIGPLAPTQDTVGVLGTTVSDCSAALTALSAERPGQRDVGRVGLIADDWAKRLEPEVSAAVADSVERLRQHGVEVVDVRLPHSELAPAAAYVIMLAESARHWSADGAAVGPEVRDQLRLGRRVADADYARALEVRAAIQRRVDEALRDVDALLLASCPVVANPIGEDFVLCAGRTIPVATAHAALTSLASVSGLAAVSLPGVPAAGELPTSVQIIGRDTDVLCRCAALIERRPHAEPRANAARKLQSAQYEHGMDDG